MTNSRKPIILSSPRILTRGRILISVLTVFVLTVFVNAQDTVFRYADGATESNASGTDINTVQKADGAALGDVLKLSGTASQNSGLDIRGAYLNFTIQSDTPGTIRTIKKTAGSGRFYNFNEASGTNASITLKDLSIQGSDSAITNAIGLFFHSSTQNTTVNLTVDNVTFSGFKNGGHYGGVIGMDNAGTLTITGSGTGKIEFNNNYAKTYGGAIHGNNTTITGNVVKFTNNSANEKYGGAIYSYGGTLAITGQGDNPTIEFSGNTAGEYGGAIYSANSVAFSGNNTSAVFTGNTAATGNDIYLYGSSTVLSFADSGTYSFDGGIYVEKANAQTTINKAQVTIAGRANDSTNVYQLQNVTVSNGGKLTANMDYIDSLTGTVNLGDAGSTGSLELNAGQGVSKTLSSFTISGAGGLTKTGAGTLELTTANTFTGKTTVSGGTLKLSGDGKLASSEIDVSSGSTLTYYNTTPQNSSALTFNVNGGTLEFYNDRTNSNVHNDNNAICTGASSAGVTIKGTGGTLLIDGGGHVAALNGRNSTVTFSMDANSTIYVKNGYFMNGGYTSQNWTNNQATLKIGATGVMNLWDGTQMRIGGLIGENGAQIVQTQSGGQGIVIGNGVTADQTYTYNGTINLNNNKPLDYVGAGTQYLNGAISNAVISTKSVTVGTQTIEAGTLVIGGALSSSSATVNSGTLIIGGNVTSTTVTAPASAGTLVLGTANNEMKVGSSSTINANGGTVRVDGNVVVDSGALTVYGTWTGNGSINVKTGGEFKVDRSYTFAKGITLSGGLLVNDSSNAATVNSPITVSSASQVKADGNNLTLAGGLYGSGNLTSASSASAKWVYLTGEGNFTGNLIVKGYVVTGASGKGTAAAPASTAPYLGSGEIQLDGGLLLNNSSYWNVPNTINVVSNSSIRAGYSRPFTFSGNITGSGKLSIDNDNSWIIMKTHSDNNTFTGDVKVDYSKNDSQGRLRLAAEQPFGSNAGTGEILGTLDMNGFNQQFKGLLSDGTKGVISNGATSQSTLTLDTTSENNTYNGVIKDNIALNIKGTGTQTFANNGSTFTGNVTISGGTVKATTAHSSYTTTDLGAFSTPGGRTITVNSGAELVLGTNDVLGGCTISNFNANSMRLILNGGKLSGTNNNPLYNATFKNGAEVYANNDREQYHSFWVMGVNTVSFAGDGSTPESPVQFNGVSEAVFVPSSAELNVDDITISDASDLIVNVPFGAFSSSNVTNSVTKTGAGTMEFTKANEYTGGTTISDGVLKFTDDAVVANGPITVGANGTLEYNLSSGKTQLLTLDNTKKILSTGKVVKTGDGTLQICTSAAGQVDASSFVVSSGRLDMKEYFKGSLAVEADATLSPGNSIGKLFVDGDFNLNGGTLLMEVAGPTADDSDQLIVTNGNLIFGEGATIVLDFVNGMSPNAEFAVIIDAPNSTDDWVKYVDATYFTDLSYAQTGGRWVLSGHIDANAVPEPSTWALLVLGVIALLLRKRVRN